ncbi:hypothetical protein SAMN05444156_1991 [Verrucomicrobium sp. GAS474]|nr:hypothetical protein SAMN05444156_1991 [Verrucomicrobium sp. GAS474]
MVEGAATLVSVGVDHLPPVPAGCAPLRVILDNQAPIDIDDPAVPLGLPNLTEGGHFLRVYAIDGEGRMLGNGEAFASSRFFVHRRDFQNALVPGTPWLTVNDPAGGTLFTEEAGKLGLPSAKLALDFLVQGEGASECLIHYRLNHRDTTVPVGKKIVWNDLKAGRYTLMVELLGANGLPVQGIFNQVERTFDVQTPVKALSLVPVPSSAAATTPAAPASTSAGATSAAPTAPARTAGPKKKGE